ncbi:hypothetical protein [Salinarimonas soli]|uniref:MarR family transcriptional regulator n=1 Tax=Salinarimonas soli TaxID=1638099 RepID=A0A5B2VDZ5_9HYPH|nr:hypothetical protein [Salinarimonas soli]KAA2236856.1 hypothetical protein F0L46_12760 [Salinarimonas soli]
MTSAPLAFRVFNEIGIVERLSRTMFDRVMPDGLALPQFVVLNHFVRLGASTPRCGSAPRSRSRARR